MHPRCCERKSCSSGKGACSSRRATGLKVILKDRGIPDFQGERKNKKRQQQQHQQQQMIIMIIIQNMHPKDHWTLKTGYFEDPTPAIQVQTLPLEGPRSLGQNTHTYFYLYIEKNVKINIFINRATTTTTWNPVMASWLVATVYIYMHVL